MKKVEINQNNKLPETKVRYSGVLERAGLSTKEATVYEVLLKNGAQGIGELILKAPYKRGDLYNILYSLRDKGIIEQFSERGKIQFRALDPHKIKEHIIIEEQKYRDASMLIDSIMPGLSQYFKLTTDKPVVTVFDGYEGIKEIYEDTLRVRKPIASFLEARESDPRVWRWLRDHYVKKRVKAKIAARVILASDKVDQKSAEYVHDDKSELRETREVSKKIFSCKLEIQIYGDKVSFANYNKGDVLVGIIIDNKNIAESMRGLFELAWRSAKRD